MSVLVLPARSLSTTTDASGGAPDFYGLTPWMPAGTMSEAKTLLEIIAGGAAFRAKLAIQTAATDTTDPGSWTATGDVADPSTTPKVCSGIIALATTPGLSNVYFIRFGVAIYATTGSPIGELKLTVTARP